LPGNWKGLEFRFTYKGDHFNVAITENSLKISGKNEGKEKIKVHLCGTFFELSQNEPVSVKYN
jgi:trehalose/maltose hydrolase-like predicted phosphorylase